MILMKSWFSVKAESEKHTVNSQLQRKVSGILNVWTHVQQTRMCVLTSLQIILLFVSFFLPIFYTEEHLYMFIKYFFLLNKRGKMHEYKTILFASSESFIKVSWKNSEVLFNWDRNETI